MYNGDEIIAKGKKIEFDSINDLMDSRLVNGKRRW